MIEVWLDVKDNPNYEVSNMGQVRNKRTGRYLAQHLNREGGYLRVTIDGRHKYVHRLVAAAFYDCDDETLEVNHIDGDKMNNCLPNIEWSTRQDNIQHACINDLHHVDVRRVVRCKYCKHRHNFDWCDGQSDDFYCSKGAR